MTSDTLLRLDRLTLRNFRGFAECSIDLHPKLTVLVAENGQGKTAILDAIKIAFGLFVDTAAGTYQSRGFERSDIRLAGNQAGEMLPALPTEFRAEGQLEGHHVEWSRTRRSFWERARTSTKDAEVLRRVATGLRQSTETNLASEGETANLLPLVTCYGTGRLWSDQREVKRKGVFGVVRNERLWGYVDCLSSASSFKGLVAWFESRMSQVGDSRFSQELRKNLSLIDAVKEATRVVLGPSGWDQLDWDPELRRLVVGNTAAGRLPLSALSDGVRNMIALVADIARRCATLNPDLRGNAARSTPGILLIDEVDMHLHPRWQQLVVGLLREAFPELQMILTTHSPHVLSTIAADSIRVVRVAEGHCMVGIPDLQTQGVESTGILAHVMDVNAIPPVEQAAWLSQYRAFVQTSQANSNAAIALWGKLVQHFGEQHPVMVDIAVLRQLQEFRVANQIPPNPGGP